MAWASTTAGMCAVFLPAWAMRESPDLLSVQTPSPTVESTANSKVLPALAGGSTHVSETFSGKGGVPSRPANPNQIRARNRRKNYLPGGEFSPIIAVAAYRLAPLNARFGE